MNIRIIDVSQSHIIEKYSAHKHDYYEIVYVYQGEMQTIICNNHFYVKKGDVTFIPPGTIHEGTMGRDYIDVFIKAEDLDFSDVMCIHDYDGSVGALFSILKRILSEREANYIAIANKLLEAIIEFLKKHMQKDVRYPFVANFKNLLYANISNPDFNIAEQIKALGYSSDYFRRCFKDEVGKTPQQYLTDMRITEAKSLLKGMSFKGVYDVALRCGFSDSFYFTKVFKAHTGVSPRDYRRLNFN